MAVDLAVRLLCCFVRGWFAACVTPCVWMVVRHEQERRWYALGEYGQYARGRWRSSAKFSCRYLLPLVLVST